MEVSNLQGICELEEVVFHYPRTGNYLKDVPDPVVSVDTTVIHASSAVRKDTLNFPEPVIATTITKVVKVQIQVQVVFEKDLKVELRNSIEAINSFNKDTKNVNLFRNSS